MMWHHDRVRDEARRSAGLVLALAGALLLSTPGGARAADTKVDTSLGLIPADAAYYSAMLRNKEQLDIVRNSKAWARIQSLPLVQMAWKQVVAQYENPKGELAQIVGMLQQPDNRELLELLADAFSQEVFTYGGANWVDFAEIVKEVRVAQQYGPLFYQATGRAGGNSQTQLQARAVLTVLNKNRARLATPDFVCGFKLTDARKADKQLKRLEGLLEALAQQQPFLKGRFKRAQVGGHSFLTLTLDGSMVPWDQVPFNDVAEQPGQYDELAKKLQDLKLTIALGVRDDFLLLSIGSSTAPIERLGGKGDRLSGRPEMKPLLEVANRKLIEIGYSSKALRSRAGTGKEDIDAVAQVARKALAGAGLPEERRKALEKDVDQLAADLRQTLPALGASVDYSFLSDRGVESFTHDYSEYPNLNGSQPLTLLDHLGGNPILAVVGRSRGALENYRMFSRWIRTVYGHVEPLILDKMSDQEKEQYEKFNKAFRPLLQRLDEATATMLLPALKDGQSAFVLDAGWTSRQWLKAAPGTDKPMPMLEAALVLGVSDADLLKKAMGEYRKIANDAIVQLRELAPPGKIPEIKLARPHARAIPDIGTLFSYPLPADWGLDPQVLPTAGLADKVVTLTLSHGHAERLLADHPLKVDGGPLAKKRPLAGAAYFSWTAFMDALTPWVEMGMAAAPLDRVGIPGMEGEKGRQEILKTVHTVMEVARTFRTVTSASYFEEGRLVTHTETHIRDVGGKE
jgi:GTP:adenosylcobinamide-phosphate guanylyltransferase